MVKIITLASSSAGNCYQIDDNGSMLLLEAGIPFKQMQKKVSFQTQKIQAVLVTHEHLDHAKYVQQYLDNGMTVYMTEGTRQALNIEHYRLKTIKYNEQFNVGAFTIKAFKTIHDANQPCGYIIRTKEDKRILFATDTRYILQMLPRVTHLMIETNYDEGYLDERVQNGDIHRGDAARVIKTHMSLQTALKYLNHENFDNSHLEKVILIHLSNRNALEDKFRTEIQKATGAIVEIAGE